MKRVNCHPKLFTILLTILFLLLFTACGQREADYTLENADLEYYDITSEKSILYEAAVESNDVRIFLGMQYYQETPIQLWMTFEEERGNVYLRRADGSKELLLSDLPSPDICRWYLDEEGNFYCWNRSLEADFEETANAYIKKIDSSGKELFSRELSAEFLLWDLCQIKDGSILLLLQEGRGGGMKLVELNPANGSLSDKPGVQLGSSYSSKYIAAGSQGVLLLETSDSERITEINQNDGSVFSALSFQGTSYSIEDNSDGMELMGFRMPAEGTVEMLWADSSTGSAIQETLRLTKMKKTPIILQSIEYMEVSWLQEKIRAFNLKNDKYQVILRKPDQSSPDNYSELITIQMATGKGPDILFGNTVLLAEGLVNKGGLENLAPYMKESGILEDDYFPYAFSCWRDGEKIYTFRIGGTPSFSYLSSEPFEGREISDIESFLDALLDWDKEAFMYRAPSSVNVLLLFLDSEDLWGMVNWDKGTCDFSGELFSNMLIASKKYGLPREEARTGEWSYSRPMILSRPLQCTLCGYKAFTEFDKHGYTTFKELLGRGTAPYIGQMGYMLAMNANSAEKEGAWEFIRFFMDKETQKSILPYESRTNKAAHKEGLDQQLNRLYSDKIPFIIDDSSIYQYPNGDTEVDGTPAYTKEDITQECVEGYLQALEDAEESATLEYMRREPVYKIIKEEAEYYFEGDKSLEEVVDIINSRVGLYVGELK